MVKMLSDSPQTCQYRQLFQIFPRKKKCLKKTGEDLVQIAVEITHKLDHRPPSYFIKEIIRPKYVHPKQEEFGIAIPQLLDSIIPKCLANESLLAKIIIKKFADHLPLYRITETTGREKIKISRNLLSQCVLQIGTSLKPYREVLCHSCSIAQKFFLQTHTAPI